MARCVFWGIFFTKKDPELSSQKTLVGHEKFRHEAGYPTEPQNWSVGSMTKFRKISGKTSNVPVERNCTFLVLPLKFPKVVWFIYFATLFLLRDINWN